MIQSRIHSGPTEIPLLGAAGVNNRPYVLEYVGYT